MDLKSLRADIVFLQETNFNKEANFAFEYNLYPKAFLASQEWKKVVILTAHSCPVQVFKTISQRLLYYFVGTLGTNTLHRVRGNSCKNVTDLLFE